jgi:starch-binding outer membrane protein, SusD/RagB family
LLQAAYDDLQLPFQDQSRFWAAQQHTSDETIGPTRGPDWDDNGIWRVLHNHTWDAEHDFLTFTFNDLSRIVFSTTNVLQFNPTPSQAAQARMLRAFAVFCIADGWGQVPFREADENLLNAPRVLSAAEALDFIISELNEILPNLPDGPAYLANKDAARVLLMKVYLNRGTFLNRQNPEFPSSDMNQVITLADQIINSGKYSLAANFYDNFARNNDQLSTELIFTNQNQGGNRGGNVQSRWYCGLHYNQNPSGWNGFCTIAEFYDLFEENDLRFSADYEGVTDVSGLKVGLLEGQQFDQSGNPLSDRSGAPLSFTKEVRLTELGNNLEVTGVRVMKYPPDYITEFPANNDLVIYRYADVLLMKAEAAARTGDFGTALSLVNELRTTRSASALSSVSLDQILDERARELYWEGHRRQDLIRFGKFLQPWSEKPASGPERLLFPIPSRALAVNPNLTQNPGY